MNYPGANDPNGQQPSFLSPHVKKPFPVVLIVLGTIGVFFVLAIFGGIHAFRAVKADSAAAIAIGNSFLDTMGQHNYQSAHSLFTPTVQAKTPVGNLKDIEVLVEKHHGIYVNHGQPQWNIHNWNGQTSVRLSYPAQFSNSISTVSLTLIQTDNGYQVYDAHYDF